MIQLLALRKLGFIMYRYERKFKLPDKFWLQGFSAKSDYGKMVKLIYDLL
jgi:hypothetical protein